MMTHTYIDKSKWGDGPWQSEPDAVGWTDDDTGYVCFMGRADGGHWCGYVVLAPGHSMYGKEMEAFRGYPSHGGITFAKEIEADRLKTELMGDIVIPAPCWLVGFDCGHDDDFSPAMAGAFDGLLVDIFGRGVYREKDYVVGVTTQLAKALSKLE